VEVAGHLGKALAHPGGTVQTLRLGPVDLSAPNAWPEYLESFAGFAARGGDVTPEIASLVRRFEFDSFTYWAATRTTHLVEGRLYEYSTLQSDWLLRYDGLGYAEIDPRICNVLAQTLPVVWDRSTWRGQNVEVDEFLDDAARFGIGSGVCIPIHDASFGVARFDFEATNREPDAKRNVEIRSALGELSVAARFLHDLFVLAIRRDEFRSRFLGMPLNKRERECLALATRGLTLGQVSSELNIDVRAVNRHFDSIRAKLGCLNADEAVAYSLKSGLTPR
jgi:DNA-binding CsgD family transcriptional regulator